MRWVRWLVLMTIMAPMLTFGLTPPKAHASMEQDVQDRIVRYITQQDAVDLCNQVYLGADYTTAAPVVPETVALSSLQVATHMCGGTAPLLAEDVNDQYCTVVDNVATRLDPIFAKRFWKFGRKFVGWACVKVV